MFHKQMQAITYSDDQLAHFRKVGGKPVWDDWVNTRKDMFDARGLLDHVLAAAQ